MKSNVQIIPLIATRVCLYRENDRRRIIVRHARDGERLLFPGGKLNTLSMETLEAGARREVRQETRMSIDELELLAFLPSSRTVHIDRKEAAEIGLPSRHIPVAGLPGLVTLEVLFAAPVAGRVPTRPVEGRTVSEVRLTKDIIPLFKDRHRRAAELSLAYLCTGKAGLSGKEKKLYGAVERLIDDWAESLAG